MKDIFNLTTRQLQLETSRVLATISADNNRLAEFNKIACHDSVSWYQSVLKWYIDKHGDLPSRAGPGKEIRLLHEDI